MSEEPKFSTEKEARDYFMEKGFPIEVVEQLVAPYRWPNQLSKLIGDGHEAVQRAATGED